MESQSVFQEVFHSVFSIELGPRQLGPFTVGVRPTVGLGREKEEKGSQRKKETAVAVPGDNSELNSGSGTILYGSKRYLLKFAKTSPKQHSE